MNYLPSKLNKLRKHYNYSQQYVADKLGIDVVEYMGYENGNDMLNHGHMKKLASLYHISFNDIFKNSDDIDLPEIKEDTNEINAKYFMPENNIRNKVKGFILNHKVVSIIIGTLVLAIILLSVNLSHVYKPYTIYRENINRLSVSETTVIYIEDSGAIGFSGSNSNGQLDNLAVTSAIKVCEGDGFSAVLNEDGSVVTSGLISKNEKEVNDWRNIIDIAAGNNHLAGLDSNGRVYCVGDSEACDIAGSKGVTKIFATDNATIALNEIGTLTYSGSFIGSSSLNDFLNIKDIASSDNILAILNSEDTLNVFSKSGSFLKAETWTELVDVACGNDFVAALDKYGKVYIEIDNDEIVDEVSEWSNIIAIDAGKDYLIGFDGKNILGVGNNSYNQFVKEEKQKVTLEKVSNIEYTLDQENIYIQFDGVNNSSGYLISLNVGTGLSKRVDTPEPIVFSCENMIEGKTYTISIISLGTGDYKDSDSSEVSFVYEIPEKMIDVEIEDYKGKSTTEIKKYLEEIDVTYKAEEDEKVICDGYEEIVLSIDGLKDGQYGESDLTTKLVKFTYCKVDPTND